MAGAYGAADLVPPVLAPLTEKVVAFVVSTEPQLRQVAPVR